jgi:hypothetical protein
VAALRLTVDAATRRLEALLLKNASVDRSLEALWRGAEERRRVKGSLRRRLAAGEAQQGVSLQEAQGALAKRYTTLLGIAAVQQSAHSEKMALEEELGRLAPTLQVLSASGELENRSSDFHGFSPVLRQLLAGCRAQLAVGPRDVEEVRLVAGACARLGVPIKPPIW